MKLMKLGFCVGLGAIALGAEATQLNFLGQNRILDAIANLNVNGQHFNQTNGNSATNYLPFYDIQISSVESGGNFSYTSAQMNSTIEPTLIRSYHRAIQRAQISNSTTQGANGYAISISSIAFNVTEPTPLAIDATLVQNPNVGISSLATVGLQRNFQPIFDADGDDPVHDFFGVAEPGWNYRFDSTANASANTGVSVLSYNFEATANVKLEVGAVMPHTLEMLGGVGLFGDAESLHFQDDDSAFVLADAGNDVAEIRVLSTSWKLNPTTLWVTVRSASTHTGPVIQIVRLKNQITNEWEPVNLRTINSQLFEIRFTAPPSGGRYVNSVTGEIEARISHLPSTDLDAFDGWMSQFDVVRFAAL